MISKAQIEAAREALRQMARGKQLEFAIEIPRAMPQKKSGGTLGARRDGMSS